LWVFRTWQLVCDRCFTELGSGTLGDSLLTFQSSDNPTPLTLKQPTNRPSNIQSTTNSPPIERRQPPHPPWTTIPTIVVAPLSQPNSTRRNGFLILPVDFIGTARPPFHFTPSYPLPTDDHSSVYLLAKTSSLCPSSIPHFPPTPHTTFQFVENSVS
jgi:hypothetical protein